MRRFRLIPAGYQLGWTPYLLLAYALLIPLNLAFYHAPQRIWVSELVGIVLFLPLYFAGYWVKGLPLLAVIAAIGAFGTVYSRENPGAVAYFIYGAAFIGFAGEAGFAYAVLGGYLALIAFIAWFLQFPIYTWVMAIGFSAVIGAVNVRFAENKRSDSRLRLAHDEVERLATLAERERIARDLHDVLGHTLSVIVLKSELASKLADRDVNRAITEIRDVERIARESLAELREAVAGYRAAGIAAEIDRARNVLESADVALRVEVEALNMSVRTEGVLALALREAITNVVRHAKAHACTISLTQSGDSCRLQISDDGTGQSAPEGAGLAGMRERIEGLGGTFEHSGGAGTRLSVTLPLQAAPR